MKKTIFVCIFCLHKFNYWGTMQFDNAKSNAFRLDLIFFFSLKINWYQFADHWSFHHILRLRSENVFKLKIVSILNTQNISEQHFENKHDFTFFIWFRWELLIVSTKQIVSILLKFSALSRCGYISNDVWVNVGTN